MSQRMHAEGVAAVVGGSGGCALSGPAAALRADPDLKRLHLGLRA